MLLILSEKSFREKDLVISDIKEQSDIKESENKQNQDLSRS